MLNIEPIRALKSICRIWFLILFFFSFTFFLIPGALAGEAPNKRPNYTDRGQYNYAKFLFEEDDFTGAAREFGRIIESFPGSPYIAKAQFMTAMAYLKGAKFKQGKDEFARFTRNFPDHPLSGEVKAMLKEAEEEEKRAKFVKKKREFSQNEPIRAVQVFYFDGKTTQEIEAEMTELSRGGIDTIIVRVFHNSGDRFHPSVSTLRRKNFSAGLYFRSSHAPVIEDFLADVIPLAHKHNLKVFAWMTTRYADYGIEDNEELKCSAFDSVSGGTVTCKGLDLFNEAVVRRLEGIYSDLANYDIDGVLFQDDLVLRHTEGFGPHAAALYERDFGRPLVPERFYFKRAEQQVLDYTALFWEWASWKNRRLLSVAKRLRTVVREKRPDAKFAINLMYESVTNPGLGLAWLSQSIKESKKSNFDYYSIMAYHRQMAGELHMSRGKTKELIKAIVKEAVIMVGEPEKVMIKFQTRDWDTRERIANSEVVELLRSVRNVDGVSMTLVPYQSNFPYNELGGVSDMASGVDDIGSMDGRVR